MADWKRVLRTSGGQPQEWGTVWGMMYLCAYERVGGGDDSTLPRRVVGIGEKRAAACIDARQTLAAFDPQYRVLTRETTVERA